MHDLRRILVLRVGVALLLAFALATLFMPLLLRQRMLEEQKRGLLGEARALAGTVDAGFAEKGPDELKALAKQIMAGSRERLTIVDSQGNVLADSEADSAAMENHADRPEIKAALAGGEGTAVRRSPTLGVNMVYAAVPLREGSGAGGALRVAVHESEITGAAVATGLTLAALMAALMAAIYALILRAQRTLRDDLRDLARSAERLLEEKEEEGEAGTTAAVARPLLADLQPLSEELRALGARTVEQRRGLRAEKERLEAVLDSVGAGIIGLDGEGRVELVNPAAERILGLRREEALGRMLAEVHPSTAVDRAAMQALKGSEAEAETQINMPRRRYLRIKASPVRGSSEEIEGAIVVLDDVTAARGTERMRRDFVANVSHELRTPVANLRALVEALRLGAMEEKEKAARFLEDLDAESGRLTRLIEDLLALSRLESAEFTLQRQRVGLVGLLRDIAAGKRLLAERYGVEVRLALPGNEVHVFGDAGLITTACANLLDNAIKYNRPGGQVDIALEEGGGEARIFFADTGIGIPEEDRDRVFERFYRVDRARSRETGGTGLGLSIVKHVAELHGGRVELSSQEGGGSTFTLILPRSGGEDYTPA